MANNTLDEDLNIIANSGLPASLLPFSKEMGIISALDDEPNDVGGLTAAELKAKFDEAGLSIQKYINETLIPAVLTEDATEADRAEAERSRRAAETGRVNAEFSRTQAEAARANAEQGRVTAETDRDSAEQARISKETARVQAEEDRAEAEGERASAESARLADEIDRAGAESERVKAEIARESAEADRDGKELERQANEAERKRQETLRKNAEEARQAAEEARQGAVGAQVAQAQKAAQDAGAEREEARQMAEQAGQSAAAAQAASLQIQNMTVEAKTVASDSPAAVEKTISDGVVNLKLSIPQGANGADGASGEDGKSAYEQAVEGGYSGTEAEFKAMLASGPWVKKSGDPTISVEFLKFLNGAYGISMCQTYGVPTFSLYNDDGAVAGLPLVVKNVASPTDETDAANKKYVDDTVANAGGGVMYGTCSTDAGVAVKVVNAPGFVLKTGAVIFVKFSKDNYVTSPYLNVNMTGAKYIKKYGTTAPDNYMWQLNSIVGFVYDGTYWLMINGTTASTLYSGITKLDDNLSSSNTDCAAASSVTKLIYSMAQDLNPIVVQIQGSSNSWYVKCYPISSNVYSISFSVPRGSESSQYTMYPPTGYAFTGLYASSGVCLYYKDPNSGETSRSDGVITENGGVLFYGINTANVHEFSGTFTLEVA